jgi:hypothetical protein
MDNHTRLEPTAALVMLWSKELYRTGSAARFYARLNLSEGRQMLDACDHACPWYHEVTLNRKWFIRHLAREFIRGTGGPCQLVLPAAGKSPLALELLDDCGDGIASVIEIDIKGMDGKARLYRETVPEYADRIECVTADLFDLPGTMDAIKRTGRYDPALATCVIPEGISYYLPQDRFSGIIGLFTSDTMKNRVIFDYLLPCRLVPEERQKYPRGVWRVINRDCNTGGTTTYSQDDLDELLAPAGCCRILHHTMHDIERGRTGGNRYFPAVKDGWIQIAEGWL